MLADNIGHDDSIRAGTLRGPYLLSTKATGRVQKGDAQTDAEHCRGGD